MTTETLTAIIILLVGAHWASVVYRLHKAENELSEIRKEFAAAAIAAAHAVAKAAQAAAQVATRK